MSVFGRDVSHILSYLERWEESRAPGALLQAVSAHYGVAPDDAVTSKEEQLRDVIKHERVAFPKGISPSDEWVHATHYDALAREGLRIIRQP